MKAVDASPLRIAIYGRFCGWEKAGLMDDKRDKSCILWGLLGRPPHPERSWGSGLSYFVPVDDLTDAEASICHALMGEHGYSVYKMLEARLGEVSHG